MKQEDMTMVGSLDTFEKWWSEIVGTLDRGADVWALKDIAESAWDAGRELGQKEGYRAGLG